MSLYDYFTPPEPEYSDDEWEAAKASLWVEYRDLGWDDEDIAKRVDDYLIAEQCAARRAAVESVWADEERARRKENWS